MNSVSSESVGGALLLLALPLHRLLLHLLHLLLVGLQQEADPVRVVVHREVGQPRASVGVHHDLQWGQWGQTGYGGP